MSRDYRDAVQQLVSALGIDPASYNRFVAWCLAEQLVAELTRLVAHSDDHLEKPLWNRPDGLRRFRDLLRQQTGRKWSDADVDVLYGRVKLASGAHSRQPISSGDLLRLLWNAPHRCARCGRRPPDVVLHVDHRYPASRGGSSTFDNLQLLCAEDNLRKSAKLEEGDLWLDSV
jgi:5-methylcytosine-specific restriction endonuclease McrA